MSDATIVYVTARSLTMLAPDTVVYHVPRGADTRPAVPRPGHGPMTLGELFQTAATTLPYYVPANRDYRMRTWCGLVIWSNEQQDNGRLVPLRRDTASCFASCCQTCSPWEPDL